MARRGSKYNIDTGIDGDSHAARKVSVGNRLHFWHWSCDRSGTRCTRRQVTINGFGDKDAIEKERASIEKDYKVEAVYSPADMSKAREIADMVHDSERTFGSLDVPAVTEALTGLWQGITHTDQAMVDRTIGSC